MDQQTSASDADRASGREPGADERQPNSYGCFICGLENPIGLKMVFTEDREEQLVYAELSVSEAYRSYPGVVHGGIVSTILDETSGRALIVHTGDVNAFFATAKMEIRYRRSTPTGVPLVAVGWVERMGESRAWVRGELRLPDEGKVVRECPSERVLAECRSLLVRPQAKFLELWDQEAPFWRVYSDQEIRDARDGVGDGA